MMERLNNSYYKLTSLFHQDGNGSVSWSLNITNVNTKINISVVITRASSHETSHEIYEFRVHSSWEGEGGVKILKNVWHHFLIGNIRPRELKFQKYFCYSLPYFLITYPATYHFRKKLSTISFLMISILLIELTLFNDLLLLNHWIAFRSLMSCLIERAHSLQRIEKLCNEDL